MGLELVEGDIHAVIFFGSLPYLLVNQTAIVSDREPSVVIDGHLYLLLAGHYLRGLVELAQVGVGYYLLYRYALLRVELQAFGNQVQALRIDLVKELPPVGLLGFRQDLYDLLACSDLQGLDVRACWRASPHQHSL